MPGSDSSSSRSDASYPATRSRFHYIKRSRELTAKWMKSRMQRYSLLVLIAVDILSIFADIFISLYMCEEGKDKGDHSSLERAQEALKLVALVFSCIFMAELLLTLWAFGMKHFRRWFHCIDAAVIIVSFVVDVVLRGVTAEVVSLVILVRLFRFFKIIEETADIEDEEVEEIREKLEDLENQNAKLKEENERLRGKGREAGEHQEKHGDGS